MEDNVNPGEVYDDLGAEIQVAEAINSSPDPSVSSSTSSSSYSSIPVAKKSSKVCKKSRICRMSTGTSPRIPVSGPRTVRVVPLIEIASSDEDEEEEEMVEDIEDDLVEIFDDDFDDVTYKDIVPEDMQCLICEKQFKQKQQFIYHHRRHVTMEHFQCPTCLRGFTTLKSCFEHEGRFHSKNAKSSDEAVSVIADDGSDVEIIEDEEQEDNWLIPDGSRIITSNHFIGYRGPRLNHMKDCFDIEEKYGSKNRGVSPIIKQMRRMQPILLNQCRKRNVNTITLIR